MRGSVLSRVGKNRGKTRIGQPLSLLDLSDHIESDLVLCHSLVLGCHPPQADGTQRRERFSLGKSCVFADSASYQAATPRWFLADGGKSRRENTENPTIPAFPDGTKSFTAWALGTQSSGESKFTTTAQRARRKPIQRFSASCPSCRRGPIRTRPVVERLSQIAARDSAKRAAGFTPVVDPPLWRSGL